VRKPQDKGNAQRQIGVIQKHFYSRKKNDKFISLFSLNQDFKAYIHELNHAVMKDHGVSHYERFQQGKHLLLPLPRDSFCVPEYRTAKVHSDCHIPFKRNFYSIPHE